MNKEKRYSISVYPRQAQMSRINEGYSDYLKKVRLSEDAMIAPLSLSGFILALAQKGLNTYNEGDSE
jgi:hypothetical protein